MNQEKLTLKYYAMINFIIKTHRTNVKYSQPNFFILNKGNNSGKPLKTPCPNCFVVIFKESPDAENYFFIAESLWQVRFWHYFLTGSVIPFIRLSDFSNNFSSKAAQMMADYNNHQKSITALKMLQQNENKLMQNLKLIKELRTVIIQNQCKPIV